MGQQQSQQSKRNPHDSDEEMQDLNEASSSEEIFDEVDDFELIANDESALPTTLDEDTLNNRDAYLELLVNHIANYKGKRHRKIATTLTEKLNDIKNDNTTTIESVVATVEKIQRNKLDRIPLWKSPLVAHINKAHNEHFGHVLFSAPMEIMHEILELTGKKRVETMANLTATSTLGLKFFGDLPKATKATKALQYVLDGNEAALLAITASNIDILFTPATTVDRKGCFGKQYNNVSPVEAMLRNMDVWMIGKVAHRLPEGDTRLTDAFNKVYPKGLKAHQEQQKETAFDFSEIANALWDENVSDDDVQAALDNPHDLDMGIPLHQALAKFRKDFEEKVLKEPHANPYHLVKAFEKYAEDMLRKHNQRTDSARKKCDLFWRQVIGFVQRYLPSCDKQVFHEDLYDVVNAANLKDISRKDRFVYSDGSLFDVSGDFVSGFSYAGGAEGLQGTSAPDSVRRVLRPVAWSNAWGMAMGRAIMCGKLISNKNVKLVGIRLRQQFQSSPPAMISCHN